VPAIASPATWDTWFERWDVVCRRYALAYKEGADNHELIDIVNAQRALLKMVPRPRKAVSKSSDV
jgi:hypothetical protein